jgi:DNA-binding beta-propeller fold protein YncE
LNGVKGKFDHFAMDEEGNRHFAAAKGNQSVEVIDLAAGKVVDSLKGFGKPHGLAWIASTRTHLVPDGGKSELGIYSGSPLKRVKTLSLSEDADDMVYDQATGLLYVGHGGGNAANPAQIAVVDATKEYLVTNLYVTTHPEALEIDAKSDRIFANISDAGQVVVIDGKTHAISATWPLKSAKDNTPLAYDEADDVVFIGCRASAKIITIDGRRGSEQSILTSSAGADDLFFDPTTRRAYLISGEGAFDSVELAAGDMLKPVTVTHTVTGAKTGLLDPRNGLL